MTAAAAPQLWRHVPIVPDDPIVADRQRASLLRQQFLDPLDLNDPTPVWLDLNRIQVLTPSAADALVVQFLERARSPRNPLIMAISTWMDDIAQTLDTRLRAAHQSAFRVKSAPYSEDLYPIGDVTPLQRDTVRRLRDLGRGLNEAPTARTVAADLKLAQTAATNRLTELAEKGLVWRTERGGIYRYLHPTSVLRKSLDAIGNGHTAIASHKDAYALERQLGSPSSRHRD